MSWGNLTEPTPIGNFMRFTTAVPFVTEGTGNDANKVDFNEIFTTLNAWVFTVNSPIGFASDRNDPV